MGTEVVVEGLTKSFGRHVVWRDVTLSLPAGEVSVMLGPSGTGKTVFLKSLVGLIRPDRGRVMVDGIDTVHCTERQLYQARKLFGVMFQDGALFGSLNLYDNIAFPLREHTKKTEAEIRQVVQEKMEMVGLAGEGHKFPGEISGGMRKRAGLARALVLDPQIILCDEPDSGLDPVRTAYLSQLLIDLNAEIDATILIVTHDPVRERAQVRPDRHVGGKGRGHAGRRKGQLQRWRPQHQRDAGAHATAGPEPGDARTAGRAPAHRPSEGDAPHPAHRCAAGDPGRPVRPGRRLARPRRRPADRRGPGAGTGADPSQS
jgi:ABC-type transporter Mla maintaining outer membrane lipid asymmetry ATPase subunit MlaF